MTVFYGTLALTYIFSILATISYNKKFKIMGIFWGLLIAIVLILVSGLRSGIGDTRVYMNSYQMLDNNSRSLEISDGIVFDLFSLLLIQISTNPQVLIFVTALITNLCNLTTFFNYRSFLELELYMYITSGYFTVTMNGIRQSLAAGLLFICTKLIIKGKFKKYIIFVLLISTLHTSALIMIPVYFIVREKTWSKKIVIMIIISLVGVMFFDKFFEVLMKILQGTKYEGYSEYIEWGGSSFIRTMVNFIPVFLSYIKRSELKENWPESGIFVNMALINLIFVTLGMFNWIFNRFTIYFQLYNIILIPYIIKKCFRGKERVVLYYGFVLCYFIFFYREQVIGLNMQYPSEYLRFDNIFYKSY